MENENAKGKRTPLFTFSSLLFTLLFFVSCTKSGGLTGQNTGSGAPSGSMSGSVNGGLSPISGAVVNLYLAGNSTPIATTSTASNGTYNLAYTNPGGTGYFYLAVTGGNAGSGVNSKTQLLAMAGTAQSPKTQVVVNEFTTAAAELMGTNFGLLQDTNGAITLNAAANQAGSNNVATQASNLENVNLGTLNTGNSNVTASMTNALYAMANAFAACVQNSGSCSSLFNTAQSATGAAAVSLLDAGVNMLGNSSNAASPVYTLAFPLSQATGFSLSSSSLPSGFSFNVFSLPSSTNSFTVGSAPNGIAFDASGNTWVSLGGSSALVELGAGGAILNTFTGLPAVQGVVVDSAGNLWVCTFHSPSAIKLSPGGVTLASTALPDLPKGLAIDPSGNVWTANRSRGAGTTVTKLDSSGNILGTFQAGTGPLSIAFDASGNAWVADYDGSTVTELSSSGVNLGTFSVAAHSGFIRVDPSGNLWTGSTASAVMTKFSPNRIVLGTFSAPDLNGSTFAIDYFGNIWIGGASGVTEMSQTGVVLGHYSLSGAISGTSIDAGGNIWLSSTPTGTQVTELSGLAASPEFFPYSGPQFPQSP